MYIYEEIYVYIYICIYIYLSIYIYTSTHYISHTVIFASPRSENRSPRIGLRTQGWGGTR